MIYTDRIRARLVQLGVFSLLIVTGIGATSVWALSHQNAQLARAGTLAQALLKHGEIDMLHDTLRADVYAALKADRSDEASMAKVRRDVTRHVALINQLAAA